MTELNKYKHDREALRNPGAQTVLGKACGTRGGISAASFNIIKPRTFTFRRGTFSFRAIRRSALNAPSLAEDGRNL